MLTSLPMTTKKKCECGKERIGKALHCPGCAKEIHRKQIAANNKKLNKERREKSTFLESRTVKGFCKCCEKLGRNPNHKVSVKVQKHVVIKQPFYKFCKLCTTLAERDYTDTYSLSGLGRERD